MSERRSTESKRQVVNRSNNSELDVENASSNHDDSNDNQNQNKGDNKLVAYLELDNRTITEVSKLCKEQMTHDVADKVVEILACNVVKFEKLKEEYERAKKKLDIANKSAYDSKKQEIEAINAMRVWKFRAIYLLFTCFVIFALFMVAGDDIARFFGHSGCLSFANSKLIYGRHVRYYLVYFKYMVADLCEWIMRMTNHIINFCQNSITM